MSSSSRESAYLSGCVEFFLPHFIAYFGYYSPSVHHFLVCVFVFQFAFCSHVPLRLFKYSYSTKQQLWFLLLGCCPLGYLKINLLVFSH